ncbi:hypothetical protein GF386_03040 [Candidatus Pacearchaeota archaeon]|nr:hypothetical protein [Candidatus Pacearchaeota archaeon]MBD3283115.1 hypothetical protein [Candidatus Pacearchaeota archaeon]
MLLTSENLFLFLLAFVWIVGAVIQDFKKREVDNLWNFSLIAFALAYRLSTSVFTNNYLFFINGLAGLLIFIVLGNLFYYSRLFAGGDAKLLISLGAVLPLSYDWIVNFKIFGFFILFFLTAGSLYVFIWALFLIFKNTKGFLKESFIQFKKYKNSFYFAVFLAILWFFLVVVVGEFRFIFVSLVILLFPFLFVFSKAVEESCMVKSLKPKDLTVGEWLYKDIVVAGRKIKANWEGVSKAELRWIRKHSKRKILVKQGIPFTPSFLFSLILMIVVDFYGFF